MYLRVHVFVAPLKPDPSGDTEDGPGDKLPDLRHNQHEILS